MRLYCCDHHEVPLPAGHKFPTAKYAMLRERLSTDPRLALEPAPFADADDIELVHDRDYVRSFLKGALDPAVMRRIGFPWSQGLVKRTLASVGGTVAAARDAMECGCGGTLAGGTHHAFPSTGSGFCVFNDIAVAIRVLAPERAAVVDLDVHQGDGTALIFREDPAVLTLSIHGRNNFPFRKQESKIDIALADETGDEEYLRTLKETLPRILDFHPQIVFYQSGVDALAADTLGRLSLTHEGLKRRDRLVLETCRDAAIPTVVTLGGGYANPIDATVTAHANTFLTAAEVWREEPPRTVSATS
ncbi:MAG: histone deacetylase [bacterium]|nr:histone deacetylase [bacterium]